MTSLDGTQKNALVIGASGGIGRALADALEDRGDIDQVFRESRSQTMLDLTIEASIIDRAAYLGSLFSQDDTNMMFDYIIVATGVLAPPGNRPEKAFSSLDPTTMEHVFAINTFGPALVAKHFAKFLAKDRKSVFAVLSARVGSIGDNRLGGWMSYRSSKAALNQILRCASIEFARTHKQSVFAALHPGTVETDLTRNHARGRYTATAEESAKQMLSVLDNLSPNETGGFYAYDGKEIVW